MLAITLLDDCNILNMFVLDKNIYIPNSFMLRTLSGFGARTNRFWNISYEYIQTQMDFHFGWIIGGSGVKRVQMSMSMGAPRSSLSSLNISWYY